MFIKPAGITWAEIILNQVSIRGIIVFGSWWVQKKEKSAPIVLTYDRYSEIKFVSAFVSIVMLLRVCFKRFNNNILHLVCIFVKQHIFRQKNRNILLLTVKKTTVSRMPIGLTFYLWICMAFLNNYWYLTSIFSWIKIIAWCI